MREWVLKDWRRQASVLLANVDKEWGISIVELGDQGTLQDGRGRDTAKLGRLEEILPTRRYTVSGMKIIV